MADSPRASASRFPLPASLIELSSVRFKEFVREPEALFWTFVFPILLAIGLGIAFRNRPAEVVHVAVVGSSPEAARVAGAARKNDGLSVEQLSADSAAVALRTGRVALLVRPRPTGGVDYEFDDTRPDARSARLLVDDAIQRGFGRTDAVAIGEQHVHERGSRYIDFVIPGLLGMNIMARSIEGASGLMNVAMMPMWVLSGVFFSSENFPKTFQPIIQALPLTAANDALRANMLRGAGWSVVGPELLLLIGWTVVTLFLALRWFRWR